MRDRRSGVRCVALLALLLGLLGGGALGGVGEEGELRYIAPFEHRMAPGETLPGTEIQYLSKEADGARVRIGTEEAVRKVGDSLDWQAEPLDGVEVDWTLRLAPFSQEDMRVIGTVTVTVRDANPVQGEADTQSALHYTAPVTVNAKRDQPLAGTTITYLGSTEEGAHLGNVEGYAYRKVADSITWEGRLKERLHMRLSSRVVFYTDDNLQVAGTVALWIGP
jgi:hypothetical protein